MKRFWTRPLETYLDSLYETSLDILDHRNKKLFLQHVPVFFVFFLLIKRFLDIPRWNNVWHTDETFLEISHEIAFEVTIKPFLDTPEIFFDTPDETIIERPNGTLFDIASELFINILYT